eukprot:6208108-Pleurochrysis_carterae.AAC.5
MSGNAEYVFILLDAQRRQAQGHMVSFSPISMDQRHESKVHRVQPDECSMRRLGMCRRLGEVQKECYQLLLSTQRSSHAQVRAPVSRQGDV